MQIGSFSAHVYQFLAFYNKCLKKIRNYLQLKKKVMPITDNRHDENELKLILKLLLPCFFGTDVSKKSNGAKLISSEERNRSTGEQDADEGNYK